MNLRYLGFDQQQNSRVYRFDRVEKGQPVKQFAVTADLALFRTYHVAIQEGPALSANKLSANLLNDFDGAHELTGEDLRLYAAAKLLAETERAEKRSRSRRNPVPPAPQRSPWRNGI